MEHERKRLMSNEQAKSLIPLLEDQLEAVIDLKDDIERLLRHIKKGREIDKEYFYWLEVDAGRLLEMTMIAKKSIDEMQ